MDNKSYKKALNKINIDSKCKPSCFSYIGPTGPKGDIGPTGPATIEVNSTTTGNPGTEARVTNSGTNQVVKLDFTIPAGNIGPTGPKGDIGPTGPMGPIGTNLLKASYLVKFNNSTTTDGIPVGSNGKIPIDRIELDINNLITFNQTENTIKFNEIGYYKISFNISAYPSVTSLDFNPDTDIVSIGFKQVDTDNVYIGVGQWVYNGEAIELSASGIISVVDTNTSYELSNLSKSTIYLNTPDIKNIASTSYFSNPLVTILIEYLGKQNS